MPETNIWVVNEAGHDYSKALDLLPDAELKPLTLGDVNPLQLDRLAFHVSRGIVRYSSPDDYVLISGTPALNAVVMTLWILHHGKINLLQWDARRREYKLFTMTRDTMESTLDTEMLRNV